MSARVTIAASRLASEEADLFLPAIEREMLTWVIGVNGIAAEAAPVATGQLRRSVTKVGVEKVDKGFDVWTGFERYWYKTEFGTGPAFVAVGDGSPGTGLWAWVKTKKIATVDLGDKGIGRRQSVGSISVMDSVSRQAKRVGTMRSRIRAGKGERSSTPMDRLNRKERGIAYAVQWKILTEGIKEQKWYRPALEGGVPDLLRRIERVLSGRVR